ncbi:adenosine receptor A2b-like [Penaeus indicus]|uniref:adenosine receptor A2b-like n=1 Tax=Penaeus indicus TaxID=29960 RepID=UPI00300C2993
MSLEIRNLSDITAPLATESFPTPYPHSLTATLESEPKEWKLDWSYTVTEILVAVVAVIGNALTVTVFAVDRKLRRLTNYYIVALAVADFLVGVLGIPFAILTSIGLPKPLWPCLLMLSTLLVLCTTSIFCLVAVSVDRYLGHPVSAQVLQGHDREDCKVSFKNERMNKRVNRKRKPEQPEGPWLGT